MSADSTRSDREKVAADIGSVESMSPTDDPALEKVWRKMDLYILPVVAMFYLLSFLVSYLLPDINYKPFTLPQDRTNFGNARVAGLQKDLKLTNKQYSIALTVTYVPYIFAELPSNLLLKVCEDARCWGSELMKRRLLVPTDCYLCC